MKRLLSATALLLASLCATAQTPDLIHTPYGTVRRAPVPECKAGKHINVFLRYDNTPTWAIDASGRKTDKFVYATLAEQFVKDLEYVLQTRGFCVFHSLLYLNPTADDVAPDSSLATNPAEDPSLEGEPPYVLVSASPTALFTSCKTKSLSACAAAGVDNEVIFGFRNRWISYTPEHVHVYLLHDSRHHDEYIVADGMDANKIIEIIEWTANSIPANKTKIIFEGQELAKPETCKPSH
ncbi:MAG: hypothetical protein ACHP7P_04930 [Terriglobales bacterium]